MRVAGFEHDGAFWASLARARRQRAASRPTASSAPTTHASTVWPRPSRRIVDAKSPFTASHSRRRGRDRRGASPPRWASTPTTCAPAAPRRPAARRRQARRLQPHPRQAGASSTDEEWAAMRRHPELLARDPGLACRRWPTSRAWRAPTTSAWTAAATPTGLTGGASSTCPTASCRSPTWPRRSAPSARIASALPGRRGAVDHGPRRRTQARRRRLRGARGVAAAPRRLARRRRLTAPADR